MPAPPRDELGNVVARDFGQKLVRAEMLDQQRKPVFGAVGTGVMLSDLLPVPIGDIVEPQRCFCRRELGDQHPRLLALGRLYFFGFAARRAFRRAVKPMTSHLEVVVEVRRAAVFGLVGGQETSFRVWLVMKLSRSGSVNILRGRLVPWPM